MTRSRRRSFWMVPSLLGGALVIAILAVGCIDPMSSSLLDEVENIVDEAEADETGPPAAPTGLTATAIDTARIDLTWTDASDDEQEFQVQRSTDGGTSWGTTVSVEANLTAWSDTGLASDTEYWYRLRAANERGSSDWSPAAHAVTHAEPTYLVVYDGNGSDTGTPPSDDTAYVEGDTVVVRGAGTMGRSGGYSFLNWNVAADGTGDSYLAGGVFTMPAGNVTLYAQWTSEATYTVTYNANGTEVTGLPVDENNYLGSHSARVPTTDELSRTGHTFVHWNTESDDSGDAYTAGDLVPINSQNVTLYAIWSVNQYTLSYHGNGNTGGTVPTGGTYDYGAPMTAAAQGTLVRTGHTFQGWNSTATGDGDSYAAGVEFTMPAGNLTLYADWLPNQRTVTYEGNGNDGGSVPAGGTFDFGESVTVSDPGTLTRTGYQFEGWDSNIGWFDPGDEFAMPDEDVVFTARWDERRYLLDYNGNGATAGEIDGPHMVDFGWVMMVESPGSLEREGHSFAGWNTDPDGDGDGYQPGDSLTMPAHDVTLYAQWTAIDYTLSFDGNGHTGGPEYESVSVTYGADFTISVENPAAYIRDGYMPTGYWSTSAVAGDPQADYYAQGQTLTMPAHDVTLYVEWEPEVFPLTYYQNWGDFGSNGTSAETDETVTAWPLPFMWERTGYTFTEWNTDPGGFGDAYTVGQQFTMPPHPFELYAQWEINVYTVTYHDEGYGSGSPPDPVQAPYGSTVTVDPGGDLDWYGHEFVAWNTDPDGNGTAYDPDGPNDSFEMPAGDVDLYAIWEEIRVSLYYDGNGYTRGTLPEDRLDEPYGSSIQVQSPPDVVGFMKAPPAGTAEAAIFEAWNTEPDGTGTSYGPGTGNEYITLNEDTTLYVEWRTFVPGIDFGPGGGAVFYDKGVFSDGWRYLEVLHTSTQWSSGAWSTSNGSVGSEGEALGDGYPNTEMIYTQLGSNTAAGHCWELSFGMLGYEPYSDWFLPSLREAEELEQRSWVLDSTPVIWTSSETSWDEALLLDLSTGSSATGQKSTGADVIPIRRF